METRNFDSRAGTDTLYISTDQVPGVSAGLAIDGGNVFEELMETVKSASLGQITGALYEVGGEYRRMM